MGGDDDRAALLAVLNDFIFETKIRTTAQRLGLRAVTAQDAEQIGSLLETHKPKLLFVDLNSLGSRAIDAVRAGSAHPSQPFVLAFVSHVDEHLAKQAGDAGAHQVMPRSRFSADLPRLIAQHCNDRR